MALPRFFMTIPEGHPPLYVGMSGGINCEKPLCHHLVNVLRARPGDEVELVERDTWVVWLCRLDEVSAENVSVTVLDELLQKPLPYQTTLLFGLSKGDKNERIVRQATELGVARIMPTIFERSVSRPDAKKAARKKERLQAIAESAAEQSHRADIPKVCEILSFEEALTSLCQENPDGLPHPILVPWEEETPRALSQDINAPALKETPHITVVIGPEGGISQNEITELRNRGAHTVSLGPTILRVDTAVVATLAIVHDLLFAQA